MTFVRTRFTMWQFLSSLCLITAVSYSQTTIHGTTIVVIQKQDTILVGADSKQHFRSRYAPDAPSSRDIAVDKIQRAGNMGFVIGGIYKQWNLSGSLVFDAYQIAKTSCRGNQSILDKIRSFDRNIKRPLDLVWKELLRQNSNVDLSRYNLDFIAFGFHNNTPYVAIHSFRPQIGAHRSDPRTTLDTSQFPQPTAHDPVAYTISSITVDEEMFAAIRPLTRLSSVTYIKKVIQKAISIDSVNNGFPIKILCVTPRQMNWILN